MRLTIRLLSSVARKRPFYVTTPIFYVNAAPHLGHLYSALVADAVQRFEKLTNPDCNIIFSTGTDEHGTKIQQAAAKANLSLSTYCDKISQEYRDLFRDFNINHTDFIRTTEDRHKKAVAHFWKELVKRDYIYKAKYSGWYSVNDEAFIPETHLRDDIVDGEKLKVSIESGHSVEWTEETNYMFRLSAFKTHLQDWLKTDGVVTPSRFQKQLLDYLDNETYFPDISVSRPSSRVHWAIRLINIANAELADTLGNLAARCAAPALNISNTQHHISAETLATCRGEDTTGKLMDAVERLPEKVRKSRIRDESFKM
ncbi:Methionyl-tRNA synthetase, mitochondrial [Papilio machaon]|uniref:Methionyl-tRNA synthetase, mitochondrial n=1 Tax=Papilio machaon TaxID=76193 RepID=A0A0N0PBF0_PAPMA|nr:Methionyl-tRNA synthetase, mitochondrial [Papilio machaon]